MIPRVEELATYSEFHRFADWERLMHTNIPVVDSGAGEDVKAGGAEIPGLT